MRANFYELLAKKDFNIKEEYETLLFLFCSETSAPVGKYLRPLSMYIDEYYFRELPFRGSFTCIKNMMDTLQLNYITGDMDHLLLFCEFLIAMLPEDKAAENHYVAKQRKTIMGNINYILECTNHEIRVDSSGNSIIVEKNKAATLATQLVDDEVVAFELIEYNHFALKGDLEGKKKLLFSIAAYIEPILKSKILQQNGYRQLESDAGFLFNNFHIRHNNKVGAKAQDYITTVSDSDLDEWYDKAYEVALSVIIINDYLSIGKDITDIKTKYTWRS